MRASAPTYDSSRATASGAWVAISSSTPAKIVCSRASTRSEASVRHQPWHVALRRPSLSWTIPYPQAAVPGSMPNTFNCSVPSLREVTGLPGRACLRRRGLQDVLRDVEVRVDLLHVVVVLERVDQPHQLLRLA